MEERNSRNKDSLISASFTAWQMIQDQTSNSIKWSAYLRTLGLVEKIKLSPEELRQAAAKAIEAAENIR